MELKHLPVHNSKQFQLARKGEVYFKAHSLILFVGTNYINKHSINQVEMIYVNFIGILRGDGGGTNTHTQPHAVS